MKTKLLSCILLSSMALGATQAFAQKLDAPVAAKEDLMTFAGVEYQVSVDDKGEKTYTILDSSKEGAQEIYEAAVEENNRRIDQVLQRAEDRARSVRDAYVETGGDPEDFIPVVIDVDYEIKCQNDQYLSFILTETETRASAYTEVYTYNIDLEAGRELTLRDMLGPDYVELANAAVREGIAAREAADPDATFFHDEAGFTSIDEDQAFYINEAGNPVVLFEKYELAPGYMGQLEFEVPVP